jgi:hypothetical protein
MNVSISAVFASVKAVYENRTDILLFRQTGHIVHELPKQKYALLSSGALEQLIGFPFLSYCLST